MELLRPEWHDRLDSTNTVLLARLRRGEPLPAGFVLAARDQTGGRGRLGRAWVSQPGRDLTFSVLLRPVVRYPELLSLPMAVALGVAAALDEYGVAAHTKWPNDLLLRGRKVGGILTEQEQGSLVVGVGVNVNAGLEDLAAVGRPATSLRIETGHEYQIEPVLDRILGHLVTWTGHWERGGFPSLRSAWLTRCVGLGGPVSVVDGSGSRQGTLVGFGTHGDLLLAGPDGVVQPVWSGELECQPGAPRGQQVRRTPAGAGAGALAPISSTTTPPGTPTCCPRDWSNS